MHNPAIPSRSSREAIPPVGLVGKFRRSTRDRGVIASARASGFNEKPSLFRVATGTAAPCAITVLGM